MELREMFKKCHLVFWFILGCCCFAAESPLVWFDQIAGPCNLTRQQLAETALFLHGALKRGDSLKKILAAVPEDDSPRGIFLTLGEENWPGRTYYAVGVSLQDALAKALQLLLQNEPVYAERSGKHATKTIAEFVQEKKSVPAAWEERAKNPGRWDWLKLDVVQNVRSVRDFAVPRSRIVKTSLAGVALPEGMSFAFTGDQITGRCLLDSTRHLAKQQILNLISECYDWQALTLWLKISEMSQGYPAYVFETDSFYTDGRTVTRLYRGHPLAVEPPDRKRAEEMASGCAENLQKNLEFGKGEMKPPFPVWVGNSTRDQYAELVLAWQRLGAVLHRKDFRESAERLLSALLQYWQEDSSAKTGCVLEPERLPGDTRLLPREISALRTNALVCLGLQESSREDARVLVQQLVRHIFAQRVDRGRYVHGILGKEGKPLAETSVWDYEAPLEDVALAALAVFRAEKFLEESDRKAVEAAREDLELLLENVTKPRADGSRAVPVSSWVAEALCALPYTNVRRMQTLLLMGLTVQQQADGQPLFPDMMGSCRVSPSCTNSAELSRMLLLLAHWLAENEKNAWAKEEMAAAYPMLHFQCQGWIDLPGSSLLPSPAVYRGWFRDNLEEYGFDLRGQVKQLLSLSQYLAYAEKYPLPPSEKFQKRLLDNRKLTDIHPSVLAVEIVETDLTDSAVDHRATSGGLRQLGETPVKPGKMDMPMPGKVESRVIRKK